MTVKNLNAINYIVQYKTERYNKANDNCRWGQANEYLYQLKGMQELLKAVGINMDMEMDVDILKCTVDA
jgi:hypothetical protein